jgi:hypothetical protein
MGKLTTENRFYAPTAIIAGHTAGGRREIQMR